MPFVGPTWCDDLSICLWADTAKAVEIGTSIATGLILDLCRQHGMTPNLRKGKTAVLLSLQGKDSRQIKRTYFDGRDAGRLTVIGEHVTYQVQVCGEYKHLGGLIHAKGDMRREVGKRLAMAHTAFGLHRKLVFQNPIFPLRKRTQLFTTLVLTKLTFGMESWDLSDTKTKNKLHVGIMRLYRRLLGGAHDRHLTDQDILTTLELPSPTTLLRQTRLRYLGSLYTSAPSEIWSVLHGDVWWRCLIQDDIQWMWKQLCRSSPLTDPMTDFTYWEFLMRQYPGYWKRLVRRAVYHDVLQAKNRYIVDRAHHGITSILQEFGKLPSTIAGPTDKQVDQDVDAGPFGCLSCELPCRTRAGEAVHMQRKHGHNSKLRYLYDSTHCPACLREYHMPERVHQHLRTATRCRRILQARGGFQQPALGVGTREHKAIEEKHNRLAPYLVGHGPQPLQPSGAQLDPDDELPSHFDTSLLADIDGCIGQHEVLEDVCLLAELKATIRAKPRSWTTLTTAVGFALKELRAHPPPVEDGLAIRFCEIGPQLIDPSKWHFLGSLEKDKPYQEGGWERYIADLVMRPTAQWRQTHIPRHFGRERYFLHFFSGRRRPGDLQYYLDRHHFTGFTLYTVSIDIVVDANRGDLMKEETRQFWLRAIRQGHVVAMIGGPPCETWSQARTVSIDGNSHREGSRGP